MKKISIPLLCAQMCIIAMILSSAGLALPRLADELGLTPVQQGSLVSIQFLGFSIAVLIGGTLADRFGRLKVLRFALLGLGLAIFMFSASVEYWMTIVGVFLIGAFGSIAQNGITSLTTGYDSKNMESNYAFVQVFFTVGAVITPLMLLLFMTQLNMWRLAYYIVAVLCLGMALITVRYTEQNHKRSGSMAEAFSQYKAAFKKPIYLVAPIALLLYVGAETGVWGFVPMFFENQGYGSISGILASILIWVSMFIGRSLAVPLLKKFDLCRILLVNGVLAIASLTLVIFSNHSTAIIWIGVTGLACAPFYPFLTTWMTRLTGEQSSTILAFTMAMGALGPVIMGWPMGLIADNFGSRYITLIPALAFVVLVMVVFAFKDRKYTE